MTGIEASKCSEKSLAREAAKLTYAFANATVPKVNLINWKSIWKCLCDNEQQIYRADMVYAWPTAEME